MLKPFVILLSILLVQAQSETTDSPYKIDSADYVQASPAWLSHIELPKNVVRGYPKEEEVFPAPLPKKRFNIDLSSYPDLLKQPPVDHPEVQAVINQLDFTKIPASEPRKIKEWAVDISTYDAKKDPDCWWSASNCKKPKVSYIPEDIYMCPQKGHWGLNYDDGPYTYWWPVNEKDKEYDQPRFYNYLIEHKRQKATLFFVGSNVVKFPDAAQRALNDGHTICLHTWSHPQMTTLTSEEVVAQLYWTQKAIKEVLGITPKCWHDRVRAIAWQMGMRTILWDQDSFDWNLYVQPGKGHLKAEEIDSYFENWIQKRISNNDTEHGHITLQHENSNATISMSERWLPKIQEHFTVLPIHHCIDDSQPYWEEQWVYPTLKDPNPPTFSLGHGRNAINDEVVSSSAPFVSPYRCISLAIIAFVISYLS
ncbi:uncharacterized protein B0P05DRAFT_545554 [Gilbertella persicaria]|uniref:uncharacterized protein n=1 Tax=Gilbertella persicaria TaxID=101096 RepID=UPI00221F77FB|nr:uncharacterized protein B0P05DRAFT_545554 [Gilbertella persicaria]KAI8076708.1 hypothetical protein B0P05DRAFT_545554 [Gilbertella persicaria]